MNGIRFAGTSAKTSGTNIIVYDTQLASVQKRQIEGSIAPSQIEETETREDTIEAISSPTRGSYSTTPTSAPSTPSTTTTPATGGGYSTPSTPAPSTPSTPAPPSSSPPSSGGGGYGGGY